MATQFSMPPPSFPPPNFSQPPPSFAPRGAGPGAVGAAGYQARGQQGRDAGPKGFGSFRGTFVPTGTAADSLFDGKNMRKAVHRKTVDYNPSVMNWIENRIWQRDWRDHHVCQPDTLFMPSVVAPPDQLRTAMNCVTSRFIRTSTNKIKCPIFAVRWTPEGRRLVTGASSGEFTLWNGLTFNFETILQAHDTAVRSMVWSHNDNWMLTADHTGFVKYWQSNMNNVKMYQAHKEPIRDLSFCPSDTKYASCSDDATVRVWDFIRCTEERILRGHGADVKCVDWHPQKSLIASGSKDTQQPLKLWDPRTGTSLATLHAHKHTVMKVQWNKNGNWLLTASRDHTLKLFDVRKMSEEIQSFKGHKKEATTVAWHPIHESLFASGGSDGALMFWLVGHDKEVGSIDDAHDAMVWSMDWHPLGHLLTSGSNDHTTKFWARNRPGDAMRDRYNLNTLPVGIIEDVTLEYLDATSTESAKPAQTLPGMGLEYGLPEHLTQPLEKKSEPEPTPKGIPGFEYSDTESVMSFRSMRSSHNKKIPYAKPVPKQFELAWESGVQPSNVEAKKPGLLGDKPSQEERERAAAAGEFGEMGPPKDYQPMVPNQGPNQRHRGPRGPGPGRGGPRGPGFNEGPRGPGFNGGPRGSGFNGGPRGPGFNEGPRGPRFNQGGSRGRGPNQGGPRGAGPGMHRGPEERDDFSTMPDFEDKDRSQGPNHGGPEDESHVQDENEHRFRPDGQNYGGQNEPYSDGYNNYDNNGGPRGPRPNHGGPSGPRFGGPNQDRKPDTADGAIPSLLSINVKYPPKGEDSSRRGPPPDDDYNPYLLPPLEDEDSQFRDRDQRGCGRGGRGFSDEGRGRGGYGYEGQGRGGYNEEGYGRGRGSREGSYDDDRWESGRGRGDRGRGRGDRGRGRDTDRHWEGSKGQDENLPPFDYNDDEESRKRDWNNDNYDDSSAGAYYGSSEVGYRGRGAPEGGYRGRGGPPAKRGRGGEYEQYDEAGYENNQGADTWTSTAGGDESQWKSAEDGYPGGEGAYNAEAGGEEATAPPVFKAVDRSVFEQKMRERAERGRGGRGGPPRGRGEWRGGDADRGRGGFRGNGFRGGREEGFRGRGRGGRDMVTPL